MRKLTISAIALAVVLTLVACSSQENMEGTNSMTGAWSMTLASSAGSETLKANVNITETTGGMMNMEKMEFTMSTPCFGPEYYMEGQMSNMQDMMGNRMNMDMAMHMWSAPNKTGNHLEMKMTMNSGMNGGSGTYAMTGVTSGCNTETGTVVISRVLP